MLVLISNYLAPTLILIGLLLLGLVTIAKRRILAPRSNALLWFWRCVGFWSLVIGAAMVLS